LNPSGKLGLQGILSPVQASLETTKEINPFENGLFRQSTAPLLDPSIILPENSPTKLAEDSAPANNTKPAKKVTNDLSSDEEMLTNILQDIQSKSQERRPLHPNVLY
jgi:hypothetical protein